MGEDLQRYRDLMDEALKASAAHQIAQLDDRCRAIVAAIPDPGPAHGKAEVALFEGLRDDRRYDQIQMLGEAYIKAGFETPRLWTIYAQALIDRGIQVAALGLLDTLLAKESAKGNDVRGEIHGMRGRAWKDIAYEAINTKRASTARHALSESYQAYSRGLELAPEDPGQLAWHGTQLVAVAHLAKVNEISGLPDWQPLAGRVAQALELAIPGCTNRKDLAWFRLAAGEMRAALGELKQAKAHYEAALEMKVEVNSFMVASSHRQLTQIWNVGGTPEGGELEALVLSGLMDRKGGAILSAGGAVQLQACLEGGYDAANVKQVKAALERARSVAKIMQSYRARGTGFVVDGEKLGLGPVGKVVVTNAHVVCDPPQGDASPPDDVQIHFELYSEEFGEKEFSAQVIRSLQIDGHDCTVLKLEPDIPNEIQPLRIADLKQARNPGANVAFVIGHPLGREISFSWLNAELVGFEDLKAPHAQRMQYRSTTEQGSSGSPVFDRNWHVIGLHRAYHPSAQRLDGKAGTHAVNEGISLASIREAFTAKAPKPQKKATRR